MDTMVTFAMAGAKETMLAQAVNTHNLANASTFGFRADLISFNGEDIGASEESRVSNSINFVQGVLQYTNRPLDVAVDGDGWIAVQSADGTAAYTRRGDLHVDSAGRLSNGAGSLILGNNGPITVPPFNGIEIGTDGTVSIQPAGQAPNSRAVVDRIQLVTLDNSMLRKGEDGQMTLAGGIAEPSASVQVLSGTLEGSNVNPIEAMVRMIDLARKFESQIKMMQESGENDQTMTSLMRLS